MNSETTYCCPRDGAELDSGIFNGVPMHLCPTCNGSLVEQVRMNGLLEEMSRELQRTVPLDAPLDEVPDKGSNVACPICASSMEHYGYMGAHFIMIDACHDCRMVWLDASELGAMSIQYARTVRRSDSMRTQSESSRLESNSSLHSLNMAYMVENTLRSVFRIGNIL